MSVSDREHAGARERRRVGTWDAGGSVRGSRVTLDCSRPPVASVFASEIYSDFKKKLFSLYIIRKKCC